MQGKPRTSAGHDLAFIFFKIRETRCTKTRRSWQRRARMALAQRPDLSPAERHEICAVWSRMDCHRVNSPAMSKLQGKEHAPRDYQTITAKSCTRKAFQSVSADCSAARIGHDLKNAPHHRANCTLHHVAFSPLTILFQGCIYRRLRRDSDERRLLSDSRSNQRRRRGRKLDPCKPKKTRKMRLFSSSQKNLSEYPPSTAHEISCRSSAY